MKKVIMEAKSVCLGGETTITREGIIHFTATEKVENKAIVGRKTERMGWINIIGQQTNKKW